MDILSSKFWKAILIRALHTFLQVAIAMLPASALITEVDWGTVISTSLYAALLSVGKSVVVGIPEFKEGDDNGKQ